MIGHYDWRGGTEAMLRFGPAAGPVVMMALPPFEEANRLRAFAVAICRGLADRGIAAAIADLPGTGESLTELCATRLADWRAAFAAACDATGGAPVVASLRAAALFDQGSGTLGHWRLAPQDGQRLLREMIRTRIAGLREEGRDATSASLTELARHDGIELAGHWLSPGLFADLENADPQPAKRLRTIRLGSDAQPADRHVDAAPLWRRAEPGNDISLSRILADDIAEWIETCSAG